MHEREAFDLAYLACSAMFIYGLKQLASPRTAVRGNQLAAAAMIVVIAVTLWDSGTHNLVWIFAGMAVGGAIGVYSARAVKMTAMPQMVALFNGVGGGAAALIAFSEFHIATSGNGVMPNNELWSTLFSAIVGSISFAGSMVAFGKLQELVTGSPVTLPAQKLVNAVIFGAILVLAVWQFVGTQRELLVVIAMVLALALGVIMVMAIGGADMPVVISLLNSFTGLAAAATGFVLDNNALIIAGTLVGASGTLLTQMMGKAMNRSIANVVFGAFGTGSGNAGAAVGTAGGQVRATSADDVAVMLAYARRVVIVPGYGLAVAQAQHTIRELADHLESRGVDVRYAIHPVAGRMPGHMNVLLAEADVPYTQLYEMDDINDEFPRTDVSLVIGANDVVNPAAKNTPGSPIYGMPVLNVDQSSAVVVLKRSMNTGFAGIENELFYDPKTTMLFGDAKESIMRLIGAVKAV
ncbi:MAG TPA: NAD(P)(+) transhydrogenase (Re/Si-specific) subunit beta [Gaiellales bacterium]|jgi:NAD(P) transhydrogenase subunit beta|nr:NAD(P)(+) transhydrogenase (Re/Si-specific) subunit beta [Gaiellales bacterium]